MIHYSGYNDVLRIYATSQRDGVGFNLAFIGSDFMMPHEVPFDQTYMRTLFDYGYQRGRADTRGARHPRSLKHPPNRGAASLVPCGAVIACVPALSLLFLVLPIMGVLKATGWYH